ncbi:DNA primase [Candidatus Micrarchaeota archaeon]|nr:DNA primase [Candidatus Micrarchaeota archaeon]
MGKTYIDTVKYLVKANFEIDGIIDKPDIVGAVFGQTEGLLGDELDLRELQKNGRIGRIEVNLNVRNGRSFGNILIPSSLDMVETAILAASLEIVDRVGPCEARINVERVEDTRNLKRKILLDRAKNLLRNIVVDEIPESKELADLVRSEVKIAEVQSFGADKLPCGPDLERSDSIIIVEGRADVINLLKNGIKNVVGIGGANVGQTIADLARSKESTVFLDGDRGGEIILRELQHATDIDFVSRAPTGKEVEELTRKEMIMALRRKVPADQADTLFQGMDRDPRSRGRFERDRGGYRRDRGDRSQRRGEYTPRDVSERSATPEPHEPTSEPAPARAVAPVVSPEDAAKEQALRGQLKELEGTLKARFLDKNQTIMQEVPIREIMTALTGATDISAVILDGIVTQRLVDLAEQKKVGYAVGIRAGNLSRTPAGVRVLLAE